MMGDSFQHHLCCKGLISNLHITEMEIKQNFFFLLLFSFAYLLSNRNKLSLLYFWQTLGVLTNLFWISEHIWFRKSFQITISCFFLWYGFDVPVINFNMKNCVSSNNRTHGSQAECINLACKCWRSMYSCE